MKVGGSVALIALLLGLFPSQVLSGSLDKYSVPNGSIPPTGPTIQRDKASAPIASSRYMNTQLEFKIKSKQMAAIKLFNDQPPLEQKNWIKRYEEKKAEALEKKDYIALYYYSGILSEVCIKENDSD